MFRVAADFGQHAPAAFAFLRRARRQRRFARRMRRAEVMQISAQARIAQRPAPRAREWPGLERGADGFVPAHQLDRPGHAGAMLADFRPVFGQRVIAPGIAEFRKQREMHRSLIAEAGAPCLFRREGQRRRQPGGEAAEQNIQKAAAGAALLESGAVAIERVLADVEIEGRKIRGAEMMQRGVNAGPVMVLHRVGDFRVELPEPVQQELFECREFRLGQRLCLGKPVQRAQNPAQGVAQAAVSSACCLRISGPMRRSSDVSEFITQRRRMSAPYLSLTSCGAVTLPSDFDILRPCSSSTKPSVTMALNGATPRVPTASSSEAWNQPRCWSEPSR